MFIFGVDIEKNSKSSNNKAAKLRSMYQKLISIMWIMFLLHPIAITFSYEIRSSKTDFKETLSRKFPIVIAFALWCTLRSRHREIRNSLTNIHYLGNNLSVVFETVWTKIGLAVTVGVPLLMWLSVSIPFVENNCQKMMTYFSFNYSYVPESYNCVVLCIAMLFYNLGVYALSTSFAVFYVILCFHLSKLLHKFSKITSRNLEDKGCSAIRHHLVTYESLTQTLKSFESTMSFPIFLIQMSDCIVMFYSFVKLDPFHQSGERWFLKHYTFSLYFMALKAVASFLCVSLAATRVHEACRVIKDEQEEMLKLVIISPDMHEKELLLLLVNHNSPPFTLSAWSFFSFNRGMIMSAVGSILTYSLLILQLDIK
ncbi:hypothetical protein HNY73_007887 [Argiope bruennichi]|uniref:Gustatory receptor n=1 Tax=Argiope bruennichi TaxID=94029 RepID=A0A8T0F7B9_ARGBR|nr:hypothetical protein HNY73_007887 [Argiope bruennichi]